MPLFYNKQIKIDNSTLFHKDWYERDVCCVNDLIHNIPASFIFRKFKGKSNLDCNFLKMYRVVSKINLMRELYSHLTKTIELAVI